MGRGIETTRRARAGWASAIRWVNAQAACVQAALTAVVKPVVSPSMALTYNNICLGISLSQATLYEDLFSKTPYASLQEMAYCHVWLCLRKELSYTSINAYICTYLWRSVFQNLISEHRTTIVTSIFGFAVNAFWKRAIHIYINGRWWARESFRR